MSTVQQGQTWVLNVERKREEMGLKIMNHIIYHCRNCKKKKLKNHINIFKYSDFYSVYT